MDAAKRIAQMKWIIIDEVSMLSANLLAEIDMHLRSVMTQVNKMKCDDRDMDRSFGGINILFVGDFMQLDPTTGIGLNKIPSAWIKKGRKYAPSATDEHGHFLFWGQGEGSVQGVTVLSECKRHEEDDTWLM